MLKIQDLELNYIYTNDDNVLYKVIYINHNSNWAVCLRYSFHTKFGDSIIINDNWLNDKSNKYLQISHDPRYYGMFGSLKVKENSSLGNTLIK